jgi:hypothetical protein
MNKRKQKLAREMGDFIQKYKRKHYPGHNPNDRQYDREIEKKVKSMDPTELDELINGPYDLDDSK